MNITKHFVFVHMPKTGGSFVSDVLRTLYGATPVHRLLLRNERLLRTKNHLLRVIRRGPLDHEEFNKHGTCHEIPAYATHLPILSCIRDPLDWYVSNFKYAWWRTNPQDYPGLRNDPRWPKLSFSDYLDLSHTQWLGLLNPGIPVNPTLGRLTVLFINFYCCQPDQILTLTDDEALLAAIRSALFDLHFLTTATLNQELYDYLLGTGGYSPDQLTFILEKAKISPRNQRQSAETWPTFYSDAQAADMLHRDRLLFQLFPSLAAPEAG